MTSKMYFTFAFNFLVSGSLCAYILYKIGYMPLWARVICTTIDTLAFLFFFHALFYGIKRRLSEQA